MRLNGLARWVERSLTSRATDETLLRAAGGGPVIRIIRRPITDMPPIDQAPGCFRR
jgi:hypothetical protein